MDCRDDVSNLPPPHRQSGTSLSSSGGCYTNEIPGRDDASSLPLSYRQSDTSLSSSGGCYTNETPDRDDDLAHTVVRTVALRLSGRSCSVEYGRLSAQQLTLWIGGQEDGRGIACKG